MVPTALLWSNSYAVIQLVLADVGPLTIGAIRCTVAAAVPFVMARLRPGRVTRPDARRRRMIRLGGLLGITACFIFENTGVPLSTAADPSIIVSIR